MAVWQQQQQQQQRRRWRWWWQNVTQQCHSAGAVGRQLNITPGVVPCTAPTTTPRCPRAGDAPQPPYLPPHPGPGTPSPVLTSSSSQLSSLGTVLPPPSPHCWFGLTSARLGNHCLRNGCGSRKCQHSQQERSTPHPHGPTLRLWVRGGHSTEFPPSTRLQGRGGCPNEGVSTQRCVHAVGLWMMAQRRVPHDALLHSPLQPAVPPPVPHRLRCRRDRFASPHGTASEAVVGRNHLL